MTVSHHVRVHASSENLAREDQLAWKIAEVAADRVEVEQDVVDMIINRIIDNASVAAASLTRAPINAARAQANWPGRSPRSPPTRSPSRATWWRCWATASSTTLQ